MGPILVPVLDLVLGENADTLRRLKMENKSSFKDDIERAERMLLVFSWFGTISALAVIGYSIWGIV